METEKPKLASSSMETEKPKVEKTDANDNEINDITQVEKTLAKDSDINVIKEVEMEKPYDAVKTITKKKEIWRLGVLLEDMWTVYKGGTQGDIQVIIPTEEVNKRKDYIVYLKKCLPQSPAQ
ncbi:hypothetical protein QL285_046264 [Trifolium repens]|nr:hypothetical protein QL285_046264 [Trifolium repens]